MPRVFINQDESYTWRLISNGDIIATSHGRGGTKYVFIAITGEDICYRVDDSSYASYGKVSPGNFCNGRIIDETGIPYFIPSDLTIDTGRRIP